MTHLLHKHGGKLLRITAIEHETYGGVANWHYIGDVEWRDGSVSAASEIAPWAVCYDHDDKTACAEYGKLSTQLESYLDSHGVWVEKVKGRSGGPWWVPYKKTGRQEIERVAA